MWTLGFGAPELRDISPLFLNWILPTCAPEEITVWTAFREELTSWLCLLDDRFSEELQEAIESGVEVRQISLAKGKAARSTKLWYLLKQALSGFQRGIDLAKFVELSQNGAAAGYELWRALDQELSVRSRVEGQALREQALLIAPPKHLKRPLDIFRHMGSEFARYRKLVVTKYHDLALSEADVISCILKHLHDDCKRYLLLHGSLATLEQLERGLVFYDEQLRVLNFHKEAASAKGYPAFGGGKGDPKGKEKKGDPKGKHGGRDQKGDPKGKGKDKGNGKGGKKGDKHRRPSSAPPGKGGDKRKDGKCHYCGKPGHWARCLLFHPRRLWRLHPRHLRRLHPRRLRSAWWLLWRLLWEPLTFKKSSRSARSCRTG